MDFYRICTKEPEARKGKEVVPELFPDFVVGRSQDLMVQARSFYAVWDEEKGMWSRDEYDVQRLVDQDLAKRAKELEEQTGQSYNVKYLRSAGNGGWYAFRKFLANVSDNSKELDSTLTFADMDVKKLDYASKRLPYALAPGDYSAWDELVGTLYSVDERAKIEWIIGAIISGDSKKIQKFGVLYGPGGTGKSTIMNIMLKLFDGYTTTFEAKALGSNNNAFATEAFKNNPLLAIQQDGDLSMIADNTKLNSIISHEDMTMNEKYKPGYTNRVNAFLVMGTNLPVKISDAKSGIIRRLIDIHPTGVKIPTNHYFTLMNRVDFELGAIAYHCLEVYRSMGKNYYEKYRPTEMMLQTDVFFNFVEAHYDVFKEQDAVSLKQAYALYKEFCSDTGIEKQLPQYKVREELRNYFDDFKDRVMVDGHVMRSYYQGFNANRFKEPAKDDLTFSLVMEETESIFDEEYAGLPAQGATAQDTPLMKWSEVRTTLSDIDTSQVHFVKVPENHIVIDFDLRGEDGGKSLERNLEAASAWPATYGELSKSGGGVHLHYLWTGPNVEELNPNYSEGIEVKVYRGGSSLRRRLTRCNNVPIAEISSGLPIKEKKVQTEKRMKTEKGLRDLIAKSLRKEVHPGTFSSVSFIHHILEEAYESGMDYDVTDLQPKILAFANNSSNQAMSAIKLVQSMKFQGQEVLRSNQELAKVKDDRLVFFDVEVYPNLFVVCWKYEGSDTVVRMINPTAKDIELLMQYKLVGFNCRRYDNHILYARYMGYTIEALYQLSQKIIHNERSAMFGAAYNLSYADIWEFSSKKQTLKKFQIELGVPHVEMNIPWDEPVPVNMVNKVVDYCCNDVLSTAATFKDREQDFVARQILADVSGLTVNDTTQRHTAKIIFGDDRNAQAQFNYTHLEEEFPGYTFELGKSYYEGELVGEGGYVYAKPGMYENVGVLDVASMHPTTIEILGLFGEYTKNFADLTAARLAIKNGRYAEAKKMLGGKLAPYLTNEDAAEQLSYALKIVINIVYGMTAAKFDNPFKDVRNKDNIVAKRGALFMIDLKNACLKQGMEVLHIKTDSIKIANMTDADRQFITDFGRNYGYTFEHEATYEKFCLVNDAVYIAKVGWAAKSYKIGKWEAVGAQFQHPYVYKTLFGNDELTFDDYCETKQVVKGFMQLDYTTMDASAHESEEPVFVGRTGSFVPVTGETRGAILQKVVDGKVFAVAGTKGYLWLESEVAKELGESLQIDITYFEKLAHAAIKTIEKFGDFKKFIEG